MRKLTLLISFFAAFAANISAEEMEMDLMQNIEDTNKSLSSNIALQRVEPSLEDAKQLTSMFEVVEAHFVKKGDAENAVDLSKKSKELAQDIAKLVTEKNFDTATNLATDLSRTCKSCHTFYKKE
ncbi:MAG: hypothetical protein EOO53_13155 [Gammaproteobacteria bacterium]|nr:MAG: hypothetical protein EOO53_13155 [Gammaproteobacteria bacterium]